MQKDQKALFVVVLEGGIFLQSLNWFVLKTNLTAIHLFPVSSWVSTASLQGVFYEWLSRDHYLPFSPSSYSLRLHILKCQSSEPVRLPTTWEKKWKHPLWTALPRPREQAYLWGMVVVQALVPWLDRSQSFKYQFISMSRTSANCRSLSWVCPEGLTLLSFPFSGAFLGDLSLPPPEGPGGFFNLELFSSKIWDDSILEGPACLSEKILTHCHQSNLNWFFCLCLPSSSLSCSIPLTLSCRRSVTEPGLWLGMKRYLSFSRGRAKDQRYHRTWKF